MILGTLGSIFSLPKIKCWNTIMRENDAEYVSLCLPYISENMSQKSGKIL